MLAPRSVEDDDGRSSLTLQLLLLLLVGVVRDRVRELVLEEGGFSELPLARAAFSEADLAFHSANNLRRSLALSGADVAEGAS